MSDEDKKFAALGRAHAELRVQEAKIEALKTGVQKCSVSLSEASALVELFLRGPSITTPQLIRKQLDEAVAFAGQFVHELYEADAAARNLRNQIALWPSGKTSV